MGDSPPEGFEDFVVERGPALHRTAVLLTHQEQAAVNLVQVALAKAWRTWSRIDSNPEAYVRRIIINEFTSASPRRWHGQQPTAELPAPHRDSDSDDADSVSRALLAALATLPPSLRAVVVLRFFHDYPEAAIAEAMGTRIGTVRSRTFDALAALRVTEGLREAAVPDLAAPVRVGDVPLARTLDDLRSALHDGADAAAYPDVGVLVAGARRRVAASRRRRLAVLGAATVAVLVVGGLVMTRPTHQAVPQPAGPGPFTVSAGGDGFPEYQQGMKRLIVVDAPMLERMKGSISVPTIPGRDLALRMTCTSTTTEWNARMIAKFTAAGGAVQATCAFRGYVPIGAATDAKTAVKVEVAKNVREGALPTPSKDAKIHVAIYESVPWEDYPFPPRPADLETSAQYAWSNEPGTVRVLGPKTAQEANKAVTFTQPFDPKLMVNLQIRGPGRIRVLINGKDVSRQAPPYPPDKFISSWGYDQGGLAFPLDPSGWASPRAGATGPTTKPGTPVTVTIEPQDFQGPDWRIAVEPNRPTAG